MGNPDKRDQWGNQLDFILSCLGYAVGLGNVWRFPYLVGQNGGGVFMIPYLIMLVFAGLPTFYLELAIGQYAALTPHLLYRRMSPIFAGIGYSMVVISAYTGIYYNVIIAWSLRYLYATLESAFKGEDMPFIGCKHHWNDIRCIDATLNCTTSDPVQLYQVQGKCENSSVIARFSNGTTVTADDLSILHKTSGFSQTSSKQYNNYVLGVGTFEEGWGVPKWDLVVSLFVAWILVFLALCKGVKSSGKVVYFTATFPYLLLVVLLIRGALLEGAGDGVMYFLTGKDVNSTDNPLEKLGDSKVWSDAAQQIFFSLSLGGGGLTTLASYNQFNNNLLRDTLIVVIGNCATSVFAGFVIFPIIGYVAKISNRPVSQVAASGSALAFIVYPEGLARLSPPWLWSILFFFMLLLLGIDSQLVIVEVVVTAIIDQWPHLRRTLYKVITVACVCMVCFVIGIVFTLPQGKYLLAVVDTYAGGLPLVVCCLVEVVMVAWVYGAKRFISDIRLMMGAPPNTFWRVLGYPVSPYWWINWVFITPCLLFGVLVFMVISMSRSEDDGYLFPIEVDYVGYAIFVSCCMWIPVIGIIKMLRHIVFSDNVNWGPLLNSTPEWRPAIDTSSKKESHAMGSISHVDGPIAGSPYTHHRQESRGYSQYVDDGYGSRVHPNGGEKY